MDAEKIQILAGIIKSELLEMIPEGKFLQIYHQKYDFGEYFTVTCDDYSYTRWHDGSIGIQCPNGETEVKNLKGETDAEKIHLSNDHS